MKIIQHVDGVVTDILNARDDANNENIAVVSSIPEFIPKDGYSGLLKFDGELLYWEYVENPKSEEISDTEALNIITGEQKEYIESEDT